MDTKVNTERSGSAFKLPSANFDTVRSKSRTKYPIKINKHYNPKGSTKSLQRSYFIESMERDTDGVVSNLNLEDIIINYNI